MATWLPYTTKLQSRKRLPVGFFVLFFLASPILSGFPPNKIVSPAGRNHSGCDGSIQERLAIRCAQLD